jgi:hypothetical protein
VGGVSYVALFDLDGDNRLVRIDDDRVLEVSAVGLGALVDVDRCDE